MARCERRATRGGAAVNVGGNAELDMTDVAVGAVNVGGNAEPQHPTLPSALTILIL
jgi:hypothetical protein